VLRDDGMSYGDYVEQLTYLLFLKMADERTNAKAYYRLRGMFSQKIVDFVAQARDDGSIVAIIELDDRTHDAERDSKRDVMLASAGYRIVRWNSKTKPDAAAIRAALAPKAP
jgi:very-short-patch-repair endonuclease